MEIDKIIMLPLNTNLRVIALKINRIKINRIIKFNKMNLFNQLKAKN